MIELKNGQKIELNQAFNVDCLDFMRELPDKCIDLVLTDPPYGIGADKSTGGNNKAEIKKYSGEWDSEIPKKEIFEEIFRISKHQIIWGGNYFIDFLSNTPSMLVWDKDNTGNFADCELAWTSHKSAVRIFKHRWNGMIQENMKNKEIRIHATQKPLRLFKWCLEKYAPENAIVFDPFLGSFTTAVACHHYGLQWLGCELDEDYFREGYARYNNECKQIMMEF